MIIAHRGSSKEVENTIPAFKRALEEGYDGIELDVRLTLDSKLVCFHDAVTDRLSNISEIIAECTLDELQDIKLFPNHRIASLEEALEVIPEEKFLIIDLKIDTLPPYIYNNIIRMLPSRDNLVLVSENVELLIIASAENFKTFLTVESFESLDPQALGKELILWKVSGVSMRDNKNFNDRFFWLLKYWGCNEFCIWGPSNIDVERYKKFGAFAIIKD